MDTIPFDKKLVGRQIAIGGEHKVYSYGSNQVIKFPFGPRYWLDPAGYCDNLKRDEETSRRYFSGYLVEREIKYFETGGKSNYIIIEKLLDGRHLARQDLQNPEVRQKFEELVEKNEGMMREENLSAEFFGLRGLLFHGSREAANIIFNPDNLKLTLTDAGLMHFGRNQDKNFLVSSVTNWALQRQASLIKFYLKF